MTFLIMVVFLGAALSAPTVASVGAAVGGGIGGAVTGEPRDAIVAGVVGVPGILTGALGAAAVVGGIALLVGGFASLYTDGGGGWALALGFSALAGGAVLYVTAPFVAGVGVTLTSGLANWSGATSGFE